MADRDLQDFVNVQSIMESALVEKRVIDEVIFQEDSGSSLSTTSFVSLGRIIFVLSTRSGRTC